MRLALFLAALLAAGDAFGQGSPTEQAEALNEEGKKLYKDKSYPAAAEKFRAAIQLSADARFYFNLCATLEKLGEYDAALAACDEVYTHSPSEALKAKTGERAAEVRKKKTEAGAGAGAGGAGAGAGAGGGAAAGPGTGAAAGPEAGAGAAPGGVPAAEAEVTEKVLPPGEYRFSIGADLGVARNRSIGDERTSKNGGVLKLHADFLILPFARLGLRSMLDFFSYNGGADQVALGTEVNLQVTDFGGGMFWHARITDQFWVTPFAGVSFTIMQPEFSDELTVNADPYVTFGFRAEAMAQYLFPGGHHVISLGPLISTYLPATNDNAVRLPQDWGLDKGGMAWAITAGYTYRFTEALPAFVTLE